MRTPTELREKIAHLLWYKQELIYYFRLIDMRAHEHAVMAAYYRTVDNEIAMLRWALGEVDSTWSDDTSMYMDLVDVVKNLPPTEFPYLPYKRIAREHWGASPAKVCAYISGPDSPNDEPDFDFTKALDPATWKKQPTVARHNPRFYEPGTWPAQ